MMDLKEAQRENAEVQEAVMAKKIRIFNGGGGLERELNILMWEMCKFAEDKKGAESPNFEIYTHGDDDG